MHHTKKIPLSFTANTIWPVIASKSFQQFLIRRMLPGSINIPDSFHEGKQLNSVAFVHGRSYEYTARLRVNDKQKQIDVAVDIDQFDAQVRINLQPNGSHSVVMVDSSIEGSGVSGILLQTNKRFFQKKLNQLVKSFEIELQKHLNKM